LPRRSSSDRTIASATSRFERRRCRGAWEDSGKTVVMVTHDVDEALYLADRLILMTDGPEAMVGDVLRVPFPRPRNRPAVLGHPDYHACRRKVIDFLEHHAHQSRPSAIDGILEKRAVSFRPGCPCG
jgi:ABC-type sulfate/molybdate transport systems ATPase subunit